MLQLTAGRPVCLLSRGADEAWLWHGRYGHLNFDALRKLAQDGMVRGMPLVEHADQVCDSCLVVKQRRAPFPMEANYRADDRLDLVHGDLCGPILPPTHGGKRYFLLLVDDKSRYMWIVLLSRKDEAPAAIKRWQAGVEVETCARSELTGAASSPQRSSGSTVLTMAYAGSSLPRTRRSKTAL